MYFKMINILIGLIFLNFFLFINLKKLANFQGTQKPLAYYYIDQVEVFMIENPSDCDCMIGTKKQRESIVYHRDFYTYLEFLNMLCSLWIVLS